MTPTDDVPSILLIVTTIGGLVAGMTAAIGLIGVILIGSHA